ncbi:phosphate signaling complex protein PhoU [Mycolicibacterium sp. HS_4_1]
MRTAFHEQLDALNDRIAGLCELAATTMQLAAGALLHADVEAAEQVLDRQHEIDHGSAALEAEAFTILARQAPVARDLRAVVSTLRTVADLQRMGALAAHIAQIGRRHYPEAAVPAEVRGHFTEMGRIAAELAFEAKHIVLEEDSERAAQLGTEDEAMDDIHKRLFAIVMHPDWRHGTAAAVEVTLLSRYFERFADHVVEIADRIIYQTTGTRPN